MIRYQDIDIDRTVDNILLTLSWANSADRVAGLAWYQTAHNMAVDLAVDYGLSTGQTAGIMACFSIDASWLQTVTDTTRYLSSGGLAVVGRYGMVRKKAAAILAGCNPAAALGTKKIYCFWRNIINPGENSRVTIDRHAAAVALQPGNGRPVDRRWYNSDRKYGRLETCYRSAAAVAGIELNQDIQAITWITHRRLFVDRIPHKKREYNGR